MKRFSEMTQEELAGITDVDVTVLTEIEMMVEGIEAIPIPGPEPFFGEDLKTKDYYVITNSLLYPSLEAANQAASLAVRQRDYAQLKGVYSAKKGIEPNLQIQSLYDYEELKKVESQKNVFEKEYNAWQNRNSKFSSYVRAKNKIEDRIYDAIHEAQEGVGKAQKRKDAYDRYLVLSDGNHETAGKFFKELLANQNWEPEAIDAELLRVMTC